MKEKRPYLKFLPTLVFGIFVGIAYLIDYSGGKQIAHHFGTFAFEMLTFLPLMFILIGLFDVWVPREKIEKHIGRESGVRGTALVILLAMLQAGPLYGAFPVAHILWRKGCSLKNVFIYLGTFSGLKIPMLTFEIGFLGLKFSLLRTLFSLPLFIIIGYIMEFYLKHKNYQIHSPEGESS